jgi:electron transfer flavoprotein beta subunit
MKIIVCVKQIRYTYSRTGIDPERLYIADEDNIIRINPYDEAALEAALRIKDGNGAQVVILTLGPVIAEAELRRCLAMGADDIYQIDVEAELDSWQKSGLLANAAKDIGADIVLCGKESLDKQNGTTGAFIAQNLGLPFVSAILDIKAGDGCVEVKRSAGRGSREIFECTLPAVFSVDMGQFEPRVPAYTAKKKAQDYIIKKLSLRNEKFVKMTSKADIYQPRPRPKLVPPPDCSLPAFQRIDQLLIGSKVEKKSAILTGSSESQVQGIMEFLKEHGFLKVKKN